MARHALRMTDHEVRALQQDRFWLVVRPVIPIMSKPKTPPLTLEPWVIDGERQEDDQGRPCWCGTHPSYLGEAKWFSCPWGKPDDSLYVQEAWRRETFPASGSPPLMHYRSDKTGEHTTWTQVKMWRSAQNLRKEDARYWLQIEDVDVVQLDRLSDEECRGAGVGRFIPPFPFPERWPKNAEGQYTPCYGWEYAEDRTQFPSNPQAVLQAHWATRGVAPNAWMWKIAVRKDTNKIATVANATWPEATAKMYYLD